MTEATRKERQVKNEALFRDLNERTTRVLDDLDFDGVIDTGGPQEYMCECADAECTARVPLTNEEYERVRSSPIQFAVAPGHVVADIETIVEATERYSIVEKDPGEREIAIATDPRG